MKYPKQQLIVLNTVNGEKYNRKLFPGKHQFDIKNNHKKPKTGTGMWTSTYTPHDESPSDWYEWCSYNQSNWNGKEGILITIKKKARICTIDSYDDFMSTLHKYPYRKEDEDYATWGWSNLEMTYINFKNMKKDFDIIHLTRKGQHETHHTSTMNDLYGWDCESSLHLNNVIKSYKKINI
jgi:hypothetical protein